jgi:hypothetical protein
VAADELRTTPGPQHRGVAPVVGRPSDPALDASAWPTKKKVRDSQ